MNNRFKLSAIPEISRQSIQQFPALKLRSLLYAQYDPLAKFSTRINHALMVTGIFAFAALALMFFKPELIDQLKQLSPFHYETEAAGEVSELPKTSEQAKSQRVSLAMLSEQQNVQIIPVTETLNKPDIASEQKRVAIWLAKRYRIAGSGSKLLVESAYRSAEKAHIDPLLVLAVMAIESRMNPYSASAVRAKNLIPFITKIKHKEIAEQGNFQSAAQPMVTIEVGAHILKEYLQRGGSIEAGLKLYVSAAKIRSDRGYSARVMAEYQRLQLVSKGQSVPAYDPPLASPENKSLHEASAEAVRSDRKISAREPA